jgi:hypothetical protein
LIRFIHRPSVSIGLVVGLVVGVALAAGLAYSNLGPASRHPTSDNAAVVLGGYALVALGFMVFGAFARGRLPTVVDCAVAGAVAGVLALIIVATASATINNVWLSTVARQPDKIDGLAHSQFHTMRAYLNSQLALGLAVLPPIAATGCALFAALGALATDRLSTHN